jgi:hypothetical protein
MRFSIALLCLAIGFQNTYTADGQTVFQEDFEDGDITDGMPVKWVTRTLDTGSYEVSSGNLILKAGPDFIPNTLSLSADPVDFVMGDTSVIAQIRGEGPFDNMGIGARWNEAKYTG